MRQIIYFDRIQILDNTMNDLKTRKQLLDKLNISQLNEMQAEVIPVIENSADTILLSPTGSGKTVAFLLPLLEQLNPDLNEVQALILVPSRELAIQIESVARAMGSGLKINAVYGGRSIQKDKNELQQLPAILIGTPGRIGDHLRHERVNTETVHTLILDEFDKSLEVGFEVQMKEIISLLPALKKRVLTSATQGVAIPEFLGMGQPQKLDYTTQKPKDRLSLFKVTAESKDKLDVLLPLIHFVENAPGIIFCNYKDSIGFVSDFLYENGIDHGMFHGDMEQRDREEALIMFRNGTIDLLLATDLAARGIDIPEIKYIIHYQLPHSLEEFTHRNGRTARVNKKGSAYVLHYKGEKLRDFMPKLDEASVEGTNHRKKPAWETLFITGGRKDKISKGDIAGLFFKEGGLKKDELGVIELKQNCAYVSVKASVAKKTAELLNNSRLKKAKVRIYMMD